MNVGNPFNPHQMFVGSFIPNCIMKWHQIPSSAKLVWARLAQYAGKGGVAFPHQETLAEEVGMQVRNLHNVLKILEDNRLIRTIRPTGKDRWAHAGNKYQFLWHEIFEEDEIGGVTAGPDQQSLACREVQGNASSEVQWIASRYKEENQREENQNENMRANANASARSVKKADKTESSRPFQLLFLSLWEKKYSTTYPFTVKDGNLIKRLHQYFKGDEKRFRRTVKRYLADTHPFFSGHSIAKLVSQLTQFITPASEEENPVGRVTPEIRKYLNLDD